MAPGSPIITIRLQDRLLNWVREQARLRRIPVTEFIRGLIEQEMARMGNCHGKHSLSYYVKNGCHGRLPSAENFPNFSS